MPNIINYSEVYQGFIDEELEARSYTQFMVPNDDMIQYSGGKDVKISQLAVSGLGDYDNTSTSSYPKGSVKLEWIPYTMSMDRAVRFELGRLDPSDTNFIATTENVTRTFSRKQLVPEQDIFRFNRIYSRLAANTKYKDSHIKKVEKLTKETAVNILMEQYNRVRDDSGEDVDFVCFMALENEQAFRDASKNTNNSIVFDKSITINGITYAKCMMVNGLPCVFVPTKRLKTAIKVLDGRTNGQETGGITPDETAEQIEYLIMNSDAAMAVGKIDSLKVFSADEMQDSDETTINYHLLYDCWILENQIVTLAACVRNKV